MLSTVAVFYNLLDAQLFRAFLESRHIICFLADEHIISINPFYASTVGGVKVNVRTEQFEEAKILYEQYQHGNMEELDIHIPDCPLCGSDKVMLLPPMNTTYYNEFRCFDCDHTWDDKALHNINPGHIE